MKDVKLVTNFKLMINMILSILILVFDLSVPGYYLNSNFPLIAIFLGITFFMLTIYQFFLFLTEKEKKDKIRLLIVGCLYFVVSILAVLGLVDDAMFIVTTSVFLFSLMISQILKLFLTNKKNKLSKKITWWLLTFVFFLLGLAVINSINFEFGYYFAIIDVFFLFIIAFRNLISPTIKIDKIKIFINILNKTHLFDVLICLLALMIAFSFLFPLVDTNIGNFWNALWYSFAIVTTIGFGDYYSTTVIGRILSVILGIYGIIVVAIITSVIVNFYNAIVKEEHEKEESKKALSNDQDSEKESE